MGTCAAAAAAEDVYYNIIACIVYRRKGGGRSRDVFVRYIREEEFTDTTDTTCARAYHGGIYVFNINIKDGRGEGNNCFGCACISPYIVVGSAAVTRGSRYTRYTGNVYYRCTHAYVFYICIYNIYV